MNSEAGVEKQRDEKVTTLLTEAQAVFQENDFDQALVKLNEVKALGELKKSQLKQFEKLHQEVIEKQQFHQQMTQATIQLADASSEIKREAERILWEDPNESLPFVLDAIQSKQGNVLVQNLNQLRLMQPEKYPLTVVEILNSPEQAKFWPRLIQYLQTQPLLSIGEELFASLKQTTDPNQRSTLLQALSRTQSPPQELVLMLAPKLLQDSEDLAIEMELFTRTCITHQLFDIHSLKGFPAEMSNEQQQQLLAIPKRLKEILAKKTSTRKERLERNAALGLASQFQIQSAPVMKGRIYFSLQWR